MTNNPPTRQWFKSSRSAQGNECVEVFLADDAVGVRDSKNPGGPELFFSGKAWDDFLTSGIWRR
ncbi:DUF397 domain-containing protein [Nocardia uniformis]|uniref:DUF397 domain-containing protein n=1 Tax=Nocardia uniformis TaxID=53432 RepID=A0A849BY67_9NOCA|nr:DUF397 domain-containing protein [Nocardia uniformis]NNH70198.1 DUF397 domain-containing protein [Nocardia uniformis]